ncbi:MAG: hypothetical protein LT106_18560 [Burkholderiaceae bacterium]|nr:hypothetical protein [Burkholderiaceae bacterium]
MVGEVNVGHAIGAHFVRLGGSPEGAGWIALLWEALQGLDDWRDGDPVPHEQCERVIHVVLHDLPAHPYFRRHAGYLLPHLSALVLKWRGANAIEATKDEQHYPHAFIWRAGFYDVVLMCLALDVGADEAGRLAASVASIYGETLDEFTKEMNDA